MCLFNQPKIPAMAVARPDNAEASRLAAREARLRKARAGAAANVLTSPTGIPANTTLGGTS